MSGSGGGGGGDEGGGIQSPVSVCVVGGIEKGRHIGVNEGVVGSLASGVSGDAGGGGGIESGISGGNRRSIGCTANSCSHFRDSR